MVGYDGLAAAACGLRDRLLLLLLAALRTYVQSYLSGFSLQGPSMGQAELVENYVSLGQKKEEEEEQG